MSIICLILYLLMPMSDSHCSILARALPTDDARIHRASGMVLSGHSLRASATVWEIPLLALVQIRASVLPASCVA